MTVYSPCSRCEKILEIDTNAIMTAGYYVASAWSQFCDPTDVYVCDACMWSDPRYIAIYGKMDTLSTLTANAVPNCLEEKPVNDP